jgi:hypothetical protein
MHDLFDPATVDLDFLFGMQIIVWHLNGRLSWVGQIREGCIFE